MNMEEIKFCNTEFFQDLKMWITKTCALWPVLEVAAETL